MKRPEGFDPPTGAERADAERNPQRRRAAQEATPATPSTGAPATRSATARLPLAGRPPGQAAPPPEPPPSDRDISRELRRAERKRRRFERGEVKRFTRRSRSRRAVWLAVVGIIATLCAVLAVATYSPLLALRTVTVDGTARVDAAQVAAALDDQVGTPLALLDYDTITAELAEFRLIRSYVTEVVPPDTLLVHIVERSPVGVVKNGAGFDLVDPAGIVLQSTPQRPDGVPLIETGAEDAAGAPFGSVVEVLLALPEPVLAQVDSITATTKDNVSFVLRGVGQSVVWGSADRSAYKARVLAAMIATQDADALVEYDVSAPGSVVVTPR